MQPMLSILICALRSRREMRRKLVHGLQTQIAEIPTAEVLVYEDDGIRPSGAKRNALLASARGKYVAFVDDDDGVADDYVRRLVEATESTPDVISFNVRRHTFTRSDVQRFGLEWRDHHRMQDGTVRMTANHLCAWRREIACRVGFMPHLGYNDDVFWYKPLVASRLARTEVRIDKVLYHYRWGAENTMNQRPEMVGATKRWAAGGVPAFWLGEEIVVASHGNASSENLTGEYRSPETARPLRSVIGPFGVERLARPEQLRRLCTVQAR